jgi:hypothetical protein
VMVDGPKKRFWEREPATTDHNDLIPLTSDERSVRLPRLPWCRRGEDSLRRFDSGLSTLDARLLQRRCQIVDG